MLVYRDRTSAYSIPTLRTMYFWVIQRHQAGAYKACWKLIQAHDNFTGPCLRKVVGSVLVGEVGAIYTPALWLTFTSCLSPMRHVLVILQSLEKHSFVTTLCARPYCSLAEPHPRAQAVRGSGVMLYFRLYHSCRISADCRTGHTSRFMLHPPRIEEAKQPTWTFEPEANVIKRT